MKYIFFSISLSARVLKTTWIKYVYFIWAGLISISTLVLKQHYILDVFAGMILAATCFYLARYFVFQRQVLTN
jgi:membrane-associated phospholipid phosphatase